jgi:hypothetical protein
LRHYFRTSFSSNRFLIAGYPRRLTA